MKMKKMICLTMGLLLLVFGAAVPLAMAEDSEGIAGCASVKVDPAESLEFQQNVCNQAEGNPDTSCGSGEHGTCSSPKLNDVMPEADHCVCIGETTDIAPTAEEAVAVETVV